VTVQEMVSSFQSFDRSKAGDGSNGERFAWKVRPRRSFHKRRLTPSRRMCIAEISFICMQNVRSVVHAISPITIL